jgi:uncharacterized protein (DUF1800 family)
MSDDRSLPDALTRLRTARPATTGDLAAVLAELTRIAGGWTELLEGLREPTRRLAGPGAAASLDVACRRAEESLVELEIALGDVRDAGERTIRPNG